MACFSPRSSIREVDAVLVGGRATPTTNSCTGNRDKAPRRKCSQFLDLIGSVAVAVPADYTRYMNQACIYMRKVGEAVKDGWQPIAAEAQNLRMAQVAQSSREATMTNDSKSPVSITGRSDREEPDVSRRDFFQHAVGGAAAVGTGAFSVISMSGPVQAQYGGHLGGLYSYQRTW